MRRLLLGFCALALAACGDTGANEVWIYTSIYPRVIEKLEPALQTAFPDVTFRWYQKGSEQVAARINAEIASGDVLCDLLMTSDPFYYAQLKDRGLLLPHASPGAADLPEGLRDPENAFTTVRVPLMVIVVNHDRVPIIDHPASFKALVDPKYKGKVSMGDPLKSGTNFTTVAVLSKLYGWEYFEALHGNGVVSQGGNSAVLHRIETGERPIGVILLENVLPRIAKGAPLTIVYPTDGAIPIPSPVAIMKSTSDPELAKRVQDLFFLPEVQAAIVEGHMYSPLPNFAPPNGGRPWEDLEIYPWTAAFVDQVKRERNAIKKRFLDVMR